ncbi:MAG: hypothetical protein LPJ87_01655 [Zoogloeaceae bacterium]|nr:hypothetical protein [Zoogloeaceae bacterium]
MSHPHPHAHDHHPAQSALRVSALVSGVAVRLAAAVVAGCILWLTVWWALA